MPPAVNELFAADVDAMFGWLEIEGRFDDLAAIVLTWCFSSCSRTVLVHSYANCGVQ